MKALIFFALTTSLVACDPTHSTDSLSLNEKPMALVDKSPMLAEEAPDSEISTVVFGDDAKGLYLGLAEMGVSLSAETGAMHADRLACDTENKDPSMPSCGINTMKSSAAFYSVLDTLSYFLVPQNEVKQLVVYEVECRIVEASDFECRFTHSGI